MTTAQPNVRSEAHKATADRIDNSTKQRLAAATQVVTDTAHNMAGKARELADQPQIKQAAQAVKTSVRQTKDNPIVMIMMLGMILMAIIKAIRGAMAARRRPTNRFARVVRKVRG